ncbi:SPRY domain-containing SOCS box protein 3-like [Haliotis rubra]|uniref:SPRY domain-containing SOCS box protein 3-like n=1 Tax=Haliotis rubra TaxID=36100 RepID=UPI001EE4FE66|nr:SPRY domain-containing SOCS box protein 3-like [Haliotis rubra]XP_046568345.1 SPRY domain-containing SOCS box protein 3-like [Haliotis rubra]XP_046568346.1 SPRY domain-containing SOCS box protein 3-like [Haliotis rubra]
MAVTLWPVCLQREYLNDNWVWDYHTKPPEVLLSSDLEDAYFHTDPVDQSTGTAGVRGNKGFLDGEHFWEIIFLEPPAGTSVMVGVGTQKALLHTNNYQYVDLIGMDGESWGLSHKGRVWHRGVPRTYCDPIYDRTTVIGCYLNLYKGTLSFYKNGTDLGVAFSGLDTVREPLYPLISSTATETELGLGVRSCRYLSLQEKCCAIIKNNLMCADSVENLPLPNAIKNHIRQF